MECQLISGSLTAVSLILLRRAGPRSVGRFLRQARTIGFLPWDEPAIMRGIREVLPRR